MHSQTHSPQCCDFSVTPTQSCQLGLRARVLSGTRPVCPRGARAPRLREQIHAFVEQIDEQVSSQAAERQKAFELVARRVRRAWPAAEIVCYGSMRAGLCTPLSDMDLVVLHAPALPASTLIFILHEVLSAERSVVSTPPLPHAQHLLHLNLRLPPPTQRA